jgi:hypothetical protein
MFVVFLVHFILPFSPWIVPVFLPEYCIRIWCLPYEVLGFIISNPLVFKFRSLFSHLGDRLSVTRGAYTAFQNERVTLKVPWEPPYEHIHGYF